MRKAAIDIGSNSVLLLVAERTEKGWKTVRETSAVTALGEGTKETGLLSERAMRDTLHALDQAFEIARNEGANPIRAAATMAARIAGNTPDFLRRAEAQGTPFTVLSGEEEARLGMLAVTSDPLFRDEDTLTMIDVGGHSTEMVTVRRSPGGWERLYGKSHPVGTLGLLGGPLSKECPGPPELLRASAEIDARIGVCYLPTRSGTAVALGATGTNLVTLRERMTQWRPEAVHGATLDYEEISRAAGWLSELTLDERAALVGMEPGRERTLPAGALILERFLFAARAPFCRVSVRGWRHALLESEEPPFH